MSTERKRDEGADVPETAGAGKAGDNNFFRWVSYISPDRRVLWSEKQGDSGIETDVRPKPPYKDRSAESSRWRNVVDAAFVTRLPQCSMRTMHVDGEEQAFVLKVFPDFGPSGQLKGVIQVVEHPGGRHICDTVDRRRRDVHSVLDLTLCGVVLYNPKTERIQNVNRRMAQQTGYALTELEGCPGRVLFGDNGIALLRNIFDRMASAGDGMVWGQMLAVRDRQGRIEDYFSSLRVIASHPSPDAGDVLMISLDAPAVGPTTGEREEGPNPRFVMEALQAGLWEYDFIRRVFHYSDSYAEIFGLDGTPGGPGKKYEDWSESIYPGESQKLLYSWRQLLKEGTRYRINYRVRDIKGEWRWIMATIHAILNDYDGRPTRVIGFHMEISDAMKAESEIMDMEERFRTIFENSGIGIGVSNVDGSLERVNPALTMMLGRDVGDFRGIWLSSFSHPDHRNRFHNIMERLVRGGRRELLRDHLFLRPDGREVWTNVTATLSSRISDGERYIIIMIEDVTLGHAKQERLQFEATHDVMTGAWNRWVLLERLEQHINLAKRHRQPMAFCICDLDYFKRVNDAHGHQAGDTVLVRFVELLKQTLRDTEVIGRYGGEEFGVVFPNTGVDDACKSLSRSLTALREECFTDGEGERFSVTATFGVAGVSDAGDMTRVIADADAALYAGKEAGRNRVVRGEPSEGEWL